MAIASAGTMGSAQSKTANQSSIVLTVSAAASVGDAVVVAVAVDSWRDLIDGLTDTNVGSISDSAGNTWTLLSKPAWVIGAQTAVNVGLWASVLTSAMTSGSSTITVTFNNSASADASAITAWKFTGLSGFVSDGTAAEANTAAADPAAITKSSLTSSREYLMLHVLGAEGPNGDAYTWDADYTQFTDNGTTGGSAASNIHLRGGYRIVSGITTDTVDVTSTTADRDYQQVLAALYVPSTPLAHLFPNRANNIMLRL